jgi:hypothetical protein
MLFLSFFLPMANKIERIVESRSKWCDEHQGGHKYLYWFRSLEHNTLRLVWISIRFINNGELDGGIHNGGLQARECLREEVVL